MPETPNHITHKDIIENSEPPQNAVISKWSDYDLLLEEMSRNLGRTQVKLIKDIEEVDMYPWFATANSDIRKGQYHGEAVVLKSDRIPCNYNRWSNSLRGFCDQFAIWVSLAHKNIHTCLGIHLLDMSRPIPAMVSKYLPNGNLSTYITSHPSIDKEEMLAGVASVLAYMHSKSPAILHGDIRAMNVLVGPDCQPLLTGFDCSVTMDPLVEIENSKNLYRGTVRWMAPERLDPGSIQITLKSDVYSFGCLGVELFSGRRPFDQLLTDSNVIFEVMVRNGSPPRPVNVELSSELWGLLGKCMLHDPSARPTMQEVDEFFSTRNARRTLTQTL